MSTPHNFLGNNPGTLWQQSYKSLSDCGDTNPENPHFFSLCNPDCHTKISAGDKDLWPLYSLLWLRSDGLQACQKNEGGVTWGVRFGQLWSYPILSSHPHCFSYPHFQRKTLSWWNWWKGLSFPSLSLPLQLVKLEEAKLPQLSSSSSWRYLQVPK